MSGSSRPSRSPKPTEHYVRGQYDGYLDIDGVGTNHATVVGSNPRLVSIRDSFFGTITTGPLVPPPGDGNLNVVVTIA